MMFDSYSVMYTVFFMYILIFFLKKNINVKGANILKEKILKFLEKTFFFFNFIIILSYQLLVETYCTIFIENYEVIAFIIFFTTTVSIVSILSKFISLGNIFIFVSTLYISTLFFINSSFINQFIVLEFTTYIIMFIFLKKNTKASKNFLLIMYNIMINFFSSILLLIFFIGKNYFYGFENVMDHSIIWSEDLTNSLFIMAFLIKMGLIPIYFLKLNIYKILNANFIYFYSIQYLYYFIYFINLFLYSVFNFIFLYLTIIIFIISMSVLNNNNIKEFIFFSSLSFFSFLIFFIV